MAPPDLPEIPGRLAQRVLQAHKVPKAHLLILRVKLLLLAIYRPAAISPMMPISLPQTVTYMYGMGRNGTM